MLSLTSYVGKSARVTVMLSGGVVKGIGRLERNRSRFIAEAVHYELARRRRDTRLQSLSGRCGVALCARRRMIVDQLYQEDEFAHHFWYLKTTLEGLGVATSYNAGPTRAACRGNAPPLAVPGWPPRECPSELRWIFLPMRSNDESVERTDDREMPMPKKRVMTQAVNSHGGFGGWRCAVEHSPGEILDVLGLGASAIGRL